MINEATPQPRPTPTSLDRRQAAALVERLMALGPQSAFALRAAVDAMETPGVEATLTIKVPKNPKDYLDLRIEVPDL